MPSEIVVGSRLVIDDGVSSNHAASVGQLPAKPTTRQTEGFGVIDYEVDGEALHVLTLIGNASAFSITGWEQHALLQSTMFVIRQDVNGSRTFEYPTGPNIFWLAPPPAVNTAPSAIAAAFTAYTWDGGTTLYLEALTGPDLSNIGGSQDDYTAGPGIVVDGSTISLDPSRIQQIDDLAQQVQGLQSVLGDPLGTVATEVDLLALDDGNLTAGDYAFLANDNGSRLAGLYIYTGSEWPTIPSAQVATGIGSNTINVADSTEIDVIVENDTVVYRILEVSKDKLVIESDFSVGGHKLTDIADPVADTDAVNKRFFDANATPSERRQIASSSEIEPAIEGGMLVLKIKNTSVVLGKLLIDTDLDMQNFKLVNVGNPTDPQDLVTKQFLDDNVAPTTRIQIQLSDQIEPVVVSGKIQLHLRSNSVDNSHIGLTEALDVDGQKVVNVADPTDPQDAVTKGFFDANATPSERKPVVGSDTVAIEYDAGLDVVTPSLVAESVTNGHLSPALQTLISGITFGTAEIGPSQVRAQMPIQFFNDTGREIKVTSINAFLTLAPLGSNLRAEVVVDGQVLHTIVVADGTDTKSETVDFTIPINGKVSVRVAQVGSTQAGQDLATHFRGEIQ